VPPHHLNSQQPPSGKSNNIHAPASILIYGASSRVVGGGPAALSSHGAGYVRDLSSSPYQMKQKRGEPLQGKISLNQRLNPTLGSN
jgi:hypothetical protein